MTENQVFYLIKMLYIEYLISCFSKSKNKCNFIEANPVYRYLTFLNQWFKLKRTLNIPYYEKVIQHDLRQDFPFFIRRRNDGEILTKNCISKKRAYVKNTTLSLGHPTASHF